MSQESTHRRIAWQCRRGMLELDALLSQFHVQHFQRLSEEQQHQFSQLLQMEDQVLWQWLVTDHESVSDEFRSITQAIRQLVGAKS